MVAAVGATGGPGLDQFEPGVPVFPNAVDHRRGDRDDGADLKQESDQNGEAPQGTLASAEDHIVGSSTSLIVNQASPALLLLVVGRHLPEVRLALGEKRHHRFHVLRAADAADEGGVLALASRTHLIGPGGEQQAFGPTQ